MFELSCESLNVCDHKFGLIENVVLAIRHKPKSNSLFLIRSRIWLLLTAFAATISIVSNSSLTSAFGIQEQAVNRQPGTTALDSLRRELKALQGIAFTIDERLVQSNQVVGPVFNRTFAEIHSNRSSRFFKSRETDFEGKQVAMKQEWLYQSDGQALHASHVLLGKGVTEPTLDGLKDWRSDPYSIHFMFFQGYIWSDDKFLDVFDQNLEINKSVRLEGNLLTFGDKNPARIVMGHDLRPESYEYSAIRSPPKAANNDSAVRNSLTYRFEYDETGQLSRLIRSVSDGTSKNSDSSISYAISDRKRIQDAVEYVRFEFVEVPEDSEIEVFEAGTMKHRYRRGRFYPVLDKESIEQKKYLLNEVSPNNREKEQLPNGFGKSNTRGEN